METFPFFAAAVLTAQATGVHNELTHWGSLYIRYTAHPLAVLEHRRLWHARGLGDAFRAALKRQTASAAGLVCVGTLRAAAQ